MMDNFKKRLEKAQKNLQKGKINEALEEYLVLYHDDPSDTDLLRTIADLYLQTNQIQEAVQAFQTLIDHSHNEGSFNKALFFHRKIIKLLPHDAEKIIDLAHYLVHNNKVEEAVQEYLNAAQLLAKQDKNPAALKCYERIIELLPEETLYHERLGKFAASIDQKAVAERAMLTAGKQHLAKKNMAEAMADFEQALQVNPYNVDTVLMVSHLLALENRWEEIVKLLEIAIQENPLYPQLLEELGSAYFHLNQMEKADQSWSRLFQVKPDAYSRLVSLAERWIAERNFTNAFSLTMKLKEYCFKIHQYPVVIHLLESIAQETPNDTTVLSQLAAVHLSLNNREAYKHTLEKMFEAYWAMENSLVAAEVFDNLITVDPTDPNHPSRLERLRTKLPPAGIKTLETHLEKVMVYRRTGDQKAGSRPEASRGIEAPVPIPKSDNEVIEDLFLQAELFLKFHMSDRALAPLKNLEQLLPLPAEFQPRYAELCRVLGRPVAAPQERPAPKTEAAPPPPARPAATREVPPIATAVGREIEALAVIHRKIHLQQGARAILYTAVNELGKFLKVSRCFAALSSTDKPATTYIEYCAPSQGKSDPSTLAKLLQFCESTVGANRRPLFSDRVAEDPEVARIHGELSALGVLSMVVWPLMSHNQVLGIIGLEQGDVVRSWTGEEILILQTVSEQMTVALAHAKLRHLVKTLSVIDEDTGLIGRHSFFDCLVSEIDRAQKQTTPLSLVLLELTQWDESMKQHGSFQAMQMLRDFAQLVVAHTRETDMAVKFDRSTIALILPDTTYSDAEGVVQKLNTYAMADAAVKASVNASEELPFFYSAVAEAVISPHHDPADVATDVVFRAEQALIQGRTTLPTPQPPMDQSLLRR